MNKQQSTQRSNFASRFSVLVAMAGSAIGMGNLWRFPYLTGENGGAAFIILYLIFAFIICIPIMISEFVIGRRTGANAFHAFQALAPGSKWGFIGIFGVLGASVILSFYSVVGGWSIFYFIKSFTTGFAALQPGDAEVMFTSMSTSAGTPLFFTLLFLALTCMIIVAGVKNGIEKFTRIMMPLLFVLMVVIAIRAITLPGAGAGLEYLFKPDFSKVTSKTVLAAIGQAFFSLSLGCGTILTYASYVKKSENILKCCAYTTLADAGFALLAGCAIMPAVFAFGVSPSEGPGLVFITLPQIFSQLPAGGVIAFLFFLSLFLAAITSSISMLEVAIAYLTEEFHLSRKRAVWSSFIIFVILGGLCSLSQGPINSFKIFGLDIFSLFDFISSNILMTLGSLLIVIFCGWKMGKSNFVDEITNSGSLKISQWLLKLIIVLIRYLAPAAILIIFVMGLIG